jgi:hypothetical protein
MHDKVTYEYAVIRVVPKVEREEFLNVGVILFSKRKKYLGIKYHVDPERLRAFSTEIDPEDIQRYLDAWRAVCTGTPEGGPIGRLELPVRFRWLTAPRSTIIQSSRPHPGLCEDPERVLEQLFELYVA